MSVIRPALTNGLLGIFGVGLPKWLRDPYGYIRDQLVALYHSLGDYVASWIVNPPHPLPGPWLDYIYGNAAGLAIYLISVVGIMTIVLMVVFHRYAMLAARAGLTAIVIGGLYPVWFSAGNWLSEAGSSITARITVHTGSNSSQLLFLPNIHSVFGAIGGIFALLLVGGLLLLVFFGYEVLFVVATLVGLPLLALTPLGDGFRRKFEQLVGIVIVTSFLGRLAAVGILSLTTLVILHMPLGNSAFGAVLTLIAGFGLALVAQFYILKHADRIYGNITGRTLGTSRVTGVVQTIRLPARGGNDMSRLQSAHVASVTAAPTPSPALRRAPGGSNPAAPSSVPADDFWTSFQRRNQADS